ncbi:MAG: class I SAM-dependent methyltransferase [Pyrinomonadaceae bacterium]
MAQHKSDIEVGYDRVAEDYASDYFEELKRKPFDRDLLDGFARSVKAMGQGEVLEIGCGPGQVARYLKDRGINIRGLDLSSEMVGIARRLNPDIRFEQGDMLALRLPDESFTGVVLFYSIIHIKREEVTRALQEINRVLKRGGRMFISFHAGEGELHRDEWYGQPVSIDFRLFDKREMARYVDAAGFDDVSVMERPPYDFEYPTKRVYIFARAIKKTLKEPE